MKRLDEGAGGGSDRETLRSFLRQWNVPGPPPEIEVDLRRTFGLRGRRSRLRHAAWLSLAAAVMVLVAGQLRSPRPPLPAPAPTASLRPAPPPLPPTAVAEAGRAGVSAPAPASPPAARRPRPLAPPTSRIEVVVEPGQAELLRQYARALRRLRQAEPRPFASRIEPPPPEAAPPTPAFEAAGAGRFPEWEAGGGEWPSVHESSPTLGR